MRASATCDEQAARARHRKCHRYGDDVERRVMRAERVVEFGKLSSARQALEGAAVATLDKLQGERRRPQQPRQPLPPDMMTFQPEIEFQLDEKMFGKNLRSSTRGVAGGPSGITTEHLRPLLDDARSTYLFFRMGEKLARAQVPGVAVAAVRSSRMTALSKGDVVRRLLARTIAQQLGPAVEVATAPHQHALSTWVGVSALHMPSRLVRIEPGCHSHVSGWHWSQ